MDRATNLRDCFFVTAVMCAVAAQPLKDRRKNGWDIAFRAYLLNILMGIITTIMVPSMTEFLVVVGITLGAGYLLLEIRSAFAPVSVPAPRPRATKAKTELFLG